MNGDAADRLNRAVRGLAQRHRGRAGVLLAQHGLYPGQEFVLMELAQHGPMIQAALAEALRCEPPSVTHMVRKLEHGGYVSRSPDQRDRRAMRVELTERGRALAGEVQGVWARLARETVGDLDDGEVERATALVALLAANLDGVADAAGSGRIGG